MKKIPKRSIFITVLAVWLVLWMFFLIREDKDGQYAEVYSLYTAKGAQKMRVVLGGELYDFLVSCRSVVPARTTYELVGFEELSIDQVRARYFLWPLRQGKGETHIKIIYSAERVEMPGYEPYMTFGRKGQILKRSR